MRKLHRLCLIPFLFLGIVVQAQTRTINGKVVSAQGNQPVVGASVLIKGATAGTATDNTGSFH